MPKRAPPGGPYTIEVRTVRVRVWHQRKHYVPEGVLLRNIITLWWVDRKLSARSLGLTYAGLNACLYGYAPLSGSAFRLLQLLVTKGHSGSPKQRARRLPMLAECKGLVRELGRLRGSRQVGGQRAREEKVAGDAADRSEVR